MKSMKPKQVRAAKACIIAAVEVSPNKVGPSNLWQILQEAGLEPCDAERMIDEATCDGLIVRTKTGYKVGKTMLI
jgi:hypothetical protein